MNILLLMILCSTWTLLIHETGIFKNINKMKSDLKIVNFILKLLKCESCSSAHLFWITYLILFHSLFGFILCPLVYYLTYIIKNKIINISF